MENRQFDGRRTDFYVAPKEVAEVVNLALALRRPLLVEGEAGCGKTRLADAVAEELGLGRAVKIAVKSTARAQDLLWRFDALRRLQDAQIPGNKTAQFLYPYLQLGDLGAVIAAGKRQVVLLDEIDKADIDFPNDLLDVLEGFEFDISDLPTEEDKRCRKEKGFGRHVAAPAGAQPVVIITSNREKRLPEAFLRRCLFVRLTFPSDPQVLADIVHKNRRVEIGKLSDTLLKTAIDTFQSIRRRAVANEAQKPPSTSELIDWVHILHLQKATPEAVREDPDFPPHWQTLFKTYHDLEIYGRRDDA